MRFPFAPLAAIAVLAGPVAADPVDDGAPNRSDTVPAFDGQTEAPERHSGIDLRLDRIAGFLEHPWAVAVLPDGAGFLVTERPGQLRHITRNGVVSDPIANVPAVVAQRQGGLLDVALAPDFAESRVIYLSFARRAGLGRSATAAVRAVLSDAHDTLSDVTEIFVQRPASVAPAHFGSRIQPLPDGTLAITTGDRFIARDLAQDPSVAYGAVVRVRSDGTVPGDNPFVGVDGALPSLYSFGHRNIQGAAIQPATGALWTIEHGPAGGDELNLIAPGGNYGWPEVSYGVNYNGSEVGTGETAHAPAFVEPRYFWDPVIAPGGMAFYAMDIGDEMFPEWTGDLFIGGLVAQSLVRLDIDGDRVVAEERLAEGIGRVRDVAIDSSGAILFVTDDPVDGGLYRLHRD